MLILAISAGAQELAPVAERLAAQNTLFDEQYESDLRNIPERATAFGDYRYNDRLAERSLAALKEKEAACAALGEVTRKYPRASVGVKQAVDREQKRVKC